MDEAEVRRRMYRSADATGTGAVAAMRLVVQGWTATAAVGRALDRDAHTKADGPRRLWRAVQLLAGICCYPMVGEVGSTAVKLVTLRSGRRMGVVAIVVAMEKAHRIALKPTPKQETLFGQHAGYARSAYNRTLGEFKAGLDVGEWLVERTLRPRWNKVRGMIAPWGLATVPERGQVRHHRLRPGRRGLGRVPPLEDGQEPPPVKDGPIIGVDVGVDVDVGAGTVAICSNGNKVENPKALAASLKRLRKTVSGSAVIVER